MNPVYIFKPLLMILPKYCTVIMYALLSISALSQPVTPASSNLYIKVYGQYGFLAPGSDKGEEIPSSDPVQFKVSPKGMGGGIRAGLGVGIILNDLINLGIDGEYLKGNKLVQKQYFISESRKTGGAGHFLDTRRSVDHEIASIIPNIVFKAISTSTYYIYNRLGVVVGIPLSMTEEFYQHYNYINANAGANTIEFRDILGTSRGKHKLKVALGYQMSLGVQTSLSEKFRGFAEISAYYISFDRISYDDTERLTVTKEKNKLQTEQPTRYDHSRTSYRYTSNGATGTVVRGVPLNQTTIRTNPQEPINMNAITVGAGVAYRF